MHGKIAVTDRETSPLGVSSFPSLLKTDLDQKKIFTAMSSASILP